MYNKDALSALIAKIKENKDADQSAADLSMLKEACLNACSLMDLVRKYAVIRVFASDGAKGEDVEGTKAKKVELLRRLSFNLAALQAMTAFYAVEQVFTGDASASADVLDFSSEFSNSLYKSASAN